MFDLYRAEDLINQQEILITLIQNKMKDEYIIINKTAIQKRIEELEETFAYQAKHGHGRLCHETNLQLTELKQILSQSTLLIPEIEKALYTKGAWYEDEIQDYISNLKLDI